MSTLATEVAKFRQWARSRQSSDLQPDQYSHGAEWECDYTDWQTLYSAVDDFLAAAAHRTLTNAELELLLYVLARDNEDERVLETLQHFPGIAAQVSEAAIRFPDDDARWQATRQSMSVAEQAWLCRSWRVEHDNAASPCASATSSGAFAVVIVAPLP
jgi:hypothetical protein